MKLLRNVELLASICVMEDAKWATSYQGTKATGLREAIIARHLARARERTVEKLCNLHWLYLQQRIQTTRYRV